jgi:hypothetical protein
MATTRHVRAGLSYVAPAGLAFGATQTIVPPAKFDPAFVRAEQVMFVVAAPVIALLAPELIVRN